MPLGFVIAAVASNRCDDDVLPAILVGDRNTPHLLRGTGGTGGGVVFYEEMFSTKQVCQSDSTKIFDAALCEQIVVLFINGRFPEEDESCRGIK
jgi:hypothetical protein